MLDHSCDHIFDHSSPPHFVRIGVRNLSSSDSLNNEADYLVEKFIVHEQYKTSSGRHDIALIELQRAVTFDHHHNLPACLYQNEFKEEYFVAVGGRPRDWRMDLIVLVFPTDGLGKR